MADVKRRFYNTGDAKGFTKAAFYNAVLALASGEEVDDGLVELVRAAAEYEIEGLSTGKSAAGTGEKKDALESEYAVALRAALMKYMTKEPQSAEELITLATADGNLAPSGKEWAKPWAGRVLKAMAEAGTVKAAPKVVEKVNGKGLKTQSEVSAYAVA